MKNIKKIILSVVIVVMSVITMSGVYLADPTEAPTEGGYNGNQGKGNEVTGSASQYTAEEKGMGFIPAHTGYRFYIVDYEESSLSGRRRVKDVITDGVDVYMSQPDEVNYNIKLYNIFKEDVYNNERSITRHTKDEFDIAQSMPAPIELTGGGQFAVNGNAFKQWMLQDRGDGDNNATALIRLFWGEEVLEDFLSSSTYILVVEPIMWSNAYRFKRDTKGSYWYADPKTLFLGTANEWARYMRLWADPEGNGLSKDSKGKGCFIEVIYSSMLPNSLIIERMGTFFDPPQELGTRLSASTILLYGYGEHLYSPSDIAEDFNNTASTQTYDPKQKNRKSAAPVPQKLKDSTIIKVYEELNAKGVIVGSSMYARKFNPSRVTVNDETNLTGYTVALIRKGGSIGETSTEISEYLKNKKHDWDTLTKDTSEIRRYTLNNGAHDDLDVVLNDGETLYVLLRKIDRREDLAIPSDDAADVETNIYLSESYISKTYTASDYTIKSSDNSDVKNIEDATLLFGSFDGSGNEMVINPVCPGHKILRCTTEEHTHSEDECGLWCDEHDWWYNRQEDGGSCPGDSSCDGHVRYACNKQEHTHNDDCYEITYHKFGKFTDSSLRFRVRYGGLVQTLDVAKDVELLGRLSQNFSVKKDVDPDANGVVRAEQALFKGIDARLVVTRDNVDAVNRSGQSPNRAESNNTIKSDVTISIIEDTDGEDVNTNYRAKSGDTNESCWQTPYNFLYRALKPLQVALKTNIMVYSGSPIVSGNSNKVALNLDSNVYAYKSVDNNGAVTVFPLIQMQEQVDNNLHSLVTVGGKYLREISGFKDFAMVYISSKSSDTGTQGSDPCVPNLIKIKTP